jgi:hypothetical protein
MVGQTAGRQETVARDAALALAVTRSWQEQGAHRAATDPRRDLAVLVVGDQVSFESMSPSIAELRKTRRQYQLPDQPAFEVPAFRVVVARTLVRNPWLVAAPMARAAAPAGAKAPSIQLTTVSGSASAPQVEAFLRQRERVLLECRHTFGDTSTAATFNFRFVIGVDGFLGGVSVVQAGQGSSREEKTVECLDRELSSAKLEPPPPHMTTIAGTLSFVAEAKKP